METGLGNFQSVVGLGFERNPVARLSDQFPLDIVNHETEPLDPSDEKMVCLEREGLGVKHFLTLLVCATENGGLLGSNRSQT